MLLAAIPSLQAILATPNGSTYIGFQYNTDDHMVYAAWMRQAMDGHFFFDNRFTTAPQPGLTVHLYFWVLGLLAKLTGIPLAANLGRLLFTGLFVPLLYRLVKRISDNVFTTRLAVILTVLAGGVGFLVWHNYGVVIVKPVPTALRSLFGGRLPTDAWQPEGFVFPSMLTNGLFMVSLCLILVTFRSFLDAKEGWRPVLWGAISLGLLMNIHSYDVLIVAFAMTGFLAMQLAVMQVTWPWIGRALAITAGVLPAALWFAHVLREDAVFQARAATPTFSANFIQVFWGYFGLIVLGLGGLLLRAKNPRQRLGVGLLVLLIAGMLAAATRAVPDAYFMSPPVWAAVAAVAIAGLVCLATEVPAYNLILAWAVMGLIAPYFPALFERKLTMGLSIPWALLATLGFAQFMANRQRSERNLAAVLVTVLLGVSSIWWVVRMRTYVRNNVANTTVHPVYLSHDAQEILAAIDKDPNPRKVVLAMPGVPAAAADANSNPVLDEYTEPPVPDWNPIVSGLTGAYTFAGHWSETPDYNRMRGMASRVFLPATSPEQRQALLGQIKPNYIIQPAGYGNDIADLESLGTVVYAGNQLKLIKLSK